MKTVNALKIRNHLGDVLDTLSKNGEPVFVSKARKIKAVLITPEDFQKRFLDRQIEEKKKEMFKTVKSLSSGKTAKKSSIETLRELRGYGH